MKERRAVFAQIGVSVVLGRTAVIERARLYEDFNCLVIDRTLAVDAFNARALQKVHKTFVFAVFFALFNNRPRRFLAHPLDSLETEDDVPVNHIKDDVGAVHVRRVNGNAHAFGFRDVFRQGVRRRNFVREVRRHEFRRLMAFEPARAVRDHRIRRRMRFVKTVACKRHHYIEDIFCVLFGKIVFKCAVNKFFLFIHKDFFFLFSHRTPEHIRAAERKACNPLRNLHNLLLIDHNAVGFFKNVLEAVVGIADFFWIEFAFDKIWNIVHRPRTEQRIQGD